MIEFKIIYPYESVIYGDSFKEAVKNFIKLKHDINITKLIIQDQQRHMQANVRYYQQDGRNKVGINMFPVGYNYPVIANNTLVTTPIIDSFLPFSPVSPLSPLTVPFVPTVINIPNI